MTFLEGFLHKLLKNYVGLTSTVYKYYFVKNCFPIDLGYNNWQMQKNNYRTQGNGQGKETFYQSRMTNKELELLRSP